MVLELYSTKQTLNIILCEVWWQAFQSEPDKTVHILIRRLFTQLFSPRTPLNPPLTIYKHHLNLGNISNLEVRFACCDQNIGGFAHLERACFLLESVDAAGDAGGAMNGFESVFLDPQFDHELEFWGNDRMGHNWTSRVGAKGDGDARLCRLDQSGKTHAARDGFLALENLPFWNVVLPGNFGLGLHDERGEGGDDRDVFIEDDLNGFVGHVAAVFDAVHTVFGDPFDDAVEGCVGGDRQSVAVAFVNHGSQFLVGEFVEVVARHDFD